VCPDESCQAQPQCGGTGGGTMLRLPIPPASPDSRFGSKAHSRKTKVQIYSLQVSSQTVNDGKTAPTSVSDVFDRRERFGPTALSGCVSCCCDMGASFFYTSVAAGSHLTLPLPIHRPHCLRGRRLSPTPPTTHPASSQLWHPRFTYLPHPFAVTIPGFLMRSPPPALRVGHSYHLSPGDVPRRAFVTQVHPPSPPPLTSLPLTSPAWPLSPHESFQIAVRTVPHLLSAAVLRLPLPSYLEAPCFSHV